MKELAIVLGTTPNADGTLTIRYGKRDAAGNVTPCLSPAEQAHRDEVNRRHTERMRRWCGPQWPYARQGEW